MGEQRQRRVIAHLDCDSFYASVELLRRPDLRGQPVVVAGRGPRAVVTTASYEARRFGIHSAQPASRARRLCPQAVFLPPDFPAYREKSRELWAIVRERLGCPMQPLSLDEAYLDVTEVERPLPVLRELVAELRERTGITVSVGVGPSRLVAKTASDWQKPACFAVLSREQACQVFAASPTRILQGIGPRTQERLRARGIGTVGHLQQADEALLVALFGDRMGRWLQARAFFHDHSPVESSRVAKSRSSERTFDQDISDLTELEAVVRRLAAEVAETLAKREVRGRTIGLKLRLDDWTNITRARTLGTYTNDAQTVTEVAVSLLRENAPARPVRLAGVRVASFEAAGGGPGATVGATEASQMRLPV